eukprot:3019177-Amphidinium_carterae.1
MGYCLRTNCQCFLQFRFRNFGSKWSRNNTTWQHLNTRWSVPLAELVGPAARALSTKGSSPLTWSSNHNQSCIDASYRCKQRLLQLALTLLRHKAAKM